MRWRRHASASGVALILAGLARAGAGADGSHAAVLVAGEARARLRLEGTAPAPPSYRNAGFTQTPEGRELVIAASARAGAWTRTTFRLPAPAAGDPVAALARTAAAGARFRAEAVAAVLQAVAARVAYAPGPVAGLDEEDAHAVLAAGTGRCVGRSSLAVAALATLGIPARPARGLLLDAATGRAVPHRWIEVEYPDAGWIFSDPTESINYVSPLHLVLTPPGDPDPAYDPAAGAGLAPRLVERPGGIVPVDVRPGPGTLAERKLGLGQYAAAVVGTVRPAGDAAAASRLRLEGAAVAFETDADGLGRFGFPGLAPGTYRLVGFSGGRRSERKLQLLDGQLARVEVTVP